MTLRSADFKSAASASFAIRAVQKMNILMVPERKGIFPAIQGCL
jgi:hypothetical protein